MPILSWIGDQLTTAISDTAACLPCCPLLTCFSPALLVRFSKGHKIKQPELHLSLSPIRQKMTATAATTTTTTTNRRSIMKKRSSKTTLEQRVGEYAMESLRSFQELTQSPTPTYRKVPPNQLDFVSRLGGGSFCDVYFYSKRKIEYSWFFKNSLNKRNLPCP